MLSLNAFASNRMRNFFAVIAILLTTILFTASFTIGGSVISSMQESMMRQVGGDFHGGFKYLSQHQYDTLKKHDSIDVISYSVILAIAENEELEKRATEIRFTNDEVNAKGLFSLPTTGRLPINDDELATDTLVLEKLGIPAILGQEVTLVYSIDGQNKSETFRLVGFWEGDVLMSASQVWLSRSYVENELEKYASEDDEIIGSISANVKFSNTRNIETKLIQVILDSGYSLNEIAYGVNWAYSISTEGTLGSFIAIGFFIGMFILCGYLMISNIFYISVAKDVKYFGLLKTIGMTSRQIKSLIRLQVSLLSLIGIPLGLITGKTVGMLLVPTALSLINVNVINDTVSPIIYLFSALFTCLTIFLSISKPSRIAEKVSTIEALRRSDTDLKSKKNKSKRVKRDKKELMMVRLSKMALKNVLRNKKKMILVTISLSLGLILLNVTYSLSNSFDMDSFVSEMIGSDFVVGDVSNFNIHLNYANQETLNKAFYNEIKDQMGIEIISDIYFHEVHAPTDPQLFKLLDVLNQKMNGSLDNLDRIENQLKNTHQNLHVYGLDAYGFSKLKFIKGNLDYEKLKSGRYVYVSPHKNFEDISYYQMGDKVSLPDELGIQHTYEVLGIAEIPYNISIKHWHEVTPTFFLASEVFLGQVVDKTPMLSTIDVEEDQISNIERFLTRYVNQSDGNMVYQSKATVIAEYDKTQSAYKTVGLALSFILALIGILNFINTVITSIHARRLEFAMTESIGMTRRQTRFMLMAESLLVIGLALIFTLSLGSVISISMLNAISEGSFFIRSFYSALPSMLCAPILIIIAVLVTLLSQRHVYKTSVVVRLRESI